MIPLHQNFNSQRMTQIHVATSNVITSVNRLSLRTAVTRGTAATLLAMVSLSATSVWAAQPEQNETQGAHPIANVDAQNAAITPATSTEGIIALVNDTPILKSQYLDALNATTARMQATGDYSVNPQRLQSEVLNGLILRALQLDKVKRAGIRPKPDLVNQRLAQIAQSQGLSSLQQLQQTLDANQPGGYAKLRNQIIEDESLKSLQLSQVTNRIRITEQDIDAFLASPEAQRLERTEYRTIHIRVPFMDDYSRITDAQKEQAMRLAQQAETLLNQSNDAQYVLDQLSTTDYPIEVQGGDMGYHAAAGLPTELAQKITPLMVGQVATPQVTPQGIDIVKLVDKRGNDDLIIPQWRVRHILISNDSAGSQALAKQQINDLYEQLRQDADFSALASTYSDDPGSAGRGGDLDWVTEQQMVPEFEEMMKRTSVGDYSTPFQTQFGWHILKVEDTRQKDVSSTVKRNLAQEALFKRLAPQVQEDWLQELRANAYIKIF